MSFHLHQVTKKYKNHTVIDSVSFSIPENKITVILGKNGAGKTTLIQLMLGLILPNSGEIHYHNQPISAMGSALYTHVSAVLESVNNVYPYLTGKQNIEYFLRLSNSRKHFSDASVQTLLYELDLQDSIHQSVGEYSRGMLQKLALIIALIGDAELLFLDEPTLGLDFVSTHQLLQKIKSLTTHEGKTIVLTSHQSNIIEELADYVILIDEGTILYEGDYLPFRSTLPSEETFKIILNGEYSFLEEATIAEGQTHITSSNLRHTLTQIEQLNITQMIEKIVRHQPTLEDTLLYFYQGRGEKK